MHNSELKVHLDYTVGSPCFFYTWATVNVFSVLHIFQIIMKTKFTTYSYIQIFAQNLMEILIIIIYSTKTTPKTQKRYKTHYLHLQNSFPQRK